jgi:hypothetical protein
MRGVGFFQGRGVLSRETRVGPPGGVGEFTGPVSELVFHHRFSYLFCCCFRAVFRTGFNSDLRTQFQMPVSETSFRIRFQVRDLGTCFGVQIPAIRLRESVPMLGGTSPILDCA